jgi:hypothetical protein
LHGTISCTKAHPAECPTPAVSVPTDGDSEWLDALRDLFHLCIYTVDDVPPLFHPDTSFSSSQHYLTSSCKSWARSNGLSHIHNRQIVRTYQRMEWRLCIGGARWTRHGDAPDYDNAALLAALNVSRCSSRAIGITTIYAATGALARASLLETATGAVWRHSCSLCSSRGMHVLHPMPRCHAATYSRDSGFWR